MARPRKTNSDEKSTFNAGVSFAISILEDLAVKFDEEATNWNNENSVKFNSLESTVAKHLREDRASTIRKAIFEVLEKYNTIQKTD